MRGNTVLSQLTMSLRVIDREPGLEEWGKLDNKKHVIYFTDQAINRRFTHNMYSGNSERSPISRIEINIPGYRGGVSRLSAWGSW